MRFLYPRACNWILHKRNRDGTYTLKDCLCGCEYTLGPTIGFLWRNLDGRTDPGNNSAKLFTVRSLRYDGFPGKRGIDSAQQDPR